MIDIDELKDLNDRHGHRAGDAALRRTAAAIREGLRGTDIGARWGGDEFVVLAPSTGSAEARGLAERVRVVAAGPAAANPGVPPRTVSIGVATLDRATPFPSSEALVSAADAALYEAKIAGRNRVAQGGG
jgi:diguanylate cyclase (GGDEF)-like protein